MYSIVVFASLILHLGISIRFLFINVLILELSELGLMRMNPTIRVIQYRIRKHRRCKSIPHTFVERGELTQQQIVPGDSFFGSYETIWK